MLGESVLGQGHGRHEANGVAPVVAFARAVRRRGWLLMPRHLGRKNGHLPLGLLSVCPACGSRDLWLFPLSPIERGAIWACLGGCARSDVLDALGLDLPELLALPEAGARE